MTVVFGCKLVNGGAYIASDAAVGYADGYRQLMDEGKWWEYDGFFVGESGTDFALSRIRLHFEAKNRPPSPEMLAQCVHEVAKDLAGKEHVDYLNAQLLWICPEQIALIGGDGGIIRKRDAGCVGHGSFILEAYLADRMPPPSKRTYQKVSRVVRAGLAHTERACESVCNPFFEDRIDG